MTSENLTARHPMYDLTPEMRRDVTRGAVRIYDLPREAFELPAPGRHVVQGGIPDAAVQWALTSGFGMSRLRMVFQMPQLQETEMDPMIPKGAYESSRTPEEIRRIFRGTMREYNERVSRP